MNKELIDKIKKKGYWQVIIRPTVFNEQRFSEKKELIEIIEKSKVVLRGWDYPHIDHRQGILSSGNDSICSQVDWLEGGHIEFWQFYLNGQFVHLFIMREDYIMSKEQKERTINSFFLYKPNENKPMNKFLSVLSTLYSVTEIYCFAANLAKFANIKDDIEIIIKFADTKERTLFFWGNNSRELFNAYTCIYEPISKQKIIPANELINNPTQPALETTMQIFKEFNWKDPNKAVFSEDQKKLIERRL